MRQDGKEIEEERVYPIEVEQNRTERGGRIDPEKCERRFAIPVERGKVHFSWMRKRRSPG